ncbi:hypothetical protein K440107A6_04410 [Lawsonibacter asaccharolyticus]
MKIGNPFVSVMKQGSLELDSGLKMEDRGKDARSNSIIRAPRLSR